MRYENTGKDRFLESIPKEYIESSQIEERCKFNFSYFDSSQEAGQTLEEWMNVSGSCSLKTLFEKIKEFTRHPLAYWMKERAGSGSLKILAQYPEFPRQSDFKHPSHVPIDVTWSRFRLGNKVRLIGFIIPERICNSLNEKNAKGFLFDSNTFYVVFLDKNHKFYKSESK